MRASLRAAALVALLSSSVLADSWHNVGYGPVVAIYGPRGQPISAHELERLYTAERLARIPTSQLSGSVTAA